MDRPAKVGEGPVASADRHSRFSIILKVIVIDRVPLVTTFPMHDHLLNVIEVLIDVAEGFLQLRQLVLDDAVRRLVMKLSVKGLIASSPQSADWRPYCGGEAKCLWRHFDLLEVRGTRGNLQSDGFFDDSQPLQYLSLDSRILDGTTAARAS